MMIGFQRAGLLLLLGSGCLNAQPLPVDPALHMGKLENGLTYYIRRNTEPSGSAQLYLVNKVGSVLEDDDQQGLAHFMEHMNFNGTRHFPKNELVNTLQRAGVQFGADLNAYTTYDETVFKLPIPTQDSKLLNQGLDILRDWAHEALLDPAEVDKERGVILEEARLRKGVNDRLSRLLLPVLLNRSRYAQRFPIGLDDVIQHAPAATLRRFYHDWYRPDLQAVIVVGDVDVQQVEQLIRQKFAGLRNPANERKRPAYAVKLTGEQQFLRVTDAEKGDVSLQLYIKRNSEPLKTVQDYQQQVEKALLMQMLEGRRREAISSENNAAYTNYSVSDENLLGGIRAFILSVDAKRGRTKEAYQQAYRFLARIKHVGFTQKDLDMAKQNYSQGVERLLREKDATPSVTYMAEYQANFLKGEAIPGIGWEAAFVKGYLPKVTLGDIQKHVSALFKSGNRDILVHGPLSMKDSLPNEQQLQSWMAGVEKEKLRPFEDTDVQKPLLQTIPVAGKIISQASGNLPGVSTLMLSNGLRVLLMPDTLKKDEIQFGAYAKGGTSLYADAAYNNALNAFPLISQFGYGDLNPEELTRVLQGKVVNVRVSMEPRAVNLRGSTSPEDLETALQLTYLMFTQPRKDTVIFKSTIDRTKEALAGRYASPSNIFTDTINRVMGNNSYRAQPPSVEKVAQIDLDKAYQLYRERFADASAFTFAFVGNFDPATIIPLLEKYLGSLPALYRKEAARDLGIHIPSGKLVKKVYAGTENQAIVRMVISGDYAYSPENNLAMKALGDILQMRMLHDLREQDGQVYSPSVQTSYNKFPSNRFAYFVSYGCAPSNVGHLIGRVEQELKDLREQGPTADEAEKFKAAYAKNIDLALKDHGFWLEYLLGQEENSEPLTEVTGITDRLRKLDVQSLKKAAAQFFGQGNQIDFELLPLAFSL